MTGNNLEARIGELKADVRAAQAAERDGGWSLPSSPQRRVRAVDLFSGARGWDQYEAALGLETVGIESDLNAYDTSEAAGFHTIHGDVRDHGPADFPANDGLIGSPPCQTFAVSGLKSGRSELHAVWAAAGELQRVGRLNYRGFSDARTGLVLEPLRWALEAHKAGHPYRWIVLEQVTQVLPVWRLLSHYLGRLGYSVAFGNLDAEAYGVPQTRRRAFLVARLDGEAALPKPTHSRFHRRSPNRLDLDLPRWRTMADALGWNPFDCVGFPRKADRHDRVCLGGEWYRGRDLRRAALPSWSVTGKARSWSRFVHDGSSVRVTVEEAAQLQGFRADYPWCGPRTEQFQQIANAVPPLLGRAVLSAALGITHAREEQSA